MGVGFVQISLHWALGVQAAEAKAAAALEEQHVRLSQQFNKELRKVNNSGAAIEAIEAAERPGLPQARRAVGS
jgi:hypothetical protein